MIGVCARVFFCVRVRVLYTQPVSSRVYGVAIKLSCISRFATSEEREKARIIIHAEDGGEL